MAWLSTTAAAIEEDNRCRVTSAFGDRKKGTPLVHKGGVQKLKRTSKNFDKLNSGAPDGRFGKSCIRDVNNLDKRSNSMYFK